MTAVNRVLFAGLCFWLLVGTLRISPFYLAYFNEFVGGPSNGYRYLLDSNIDWGQDLKGLASYLRRERIDRVKLAYFGPRGVSLRMYGLDYEPLWPGVPTTGTIAISVNHLLGLKASVSPCGRPYEWLKYEWLKPMAPLVRIGYSIFIYRISDAQPLPRPIPLPPECAQDPNPPVFPQ